MRPVAKFKISANESTDWKVKVRVWKNLKQLQAQPDVGYCLAFCVPYSHKKAVKDEDGVFAEIHLALGEGFTAPIIGHECFHATVAYVSLCKFRLMNDGQAEEISAITQEHMATQILQKLKALKLKVSPI